jgi:hypothetical protein
MKKLQISLARLAACALVLGVATQAKAGTFTFTSTDGSGLNATGWVNTMDGTATAGSMTITGPADAGVWSLVNIGDISANDGAAVPSGTFVTVAGVQGNPGLDVDNWFYVNPGYQVDWYGLLFQNASGLEINLCSQYAPWAGGGQGTVPNGAYGLDDNISVGGNMTCSTPDGGLTIALLGGALVGLHALRRKLFV